MPSCTVMTGIFVAGRKELRQQAFVLRVQMLHQHERHAGVRRDGLSSCAKASSPPADAPIPTIGIRTPRGGLTSWDSTAAGYFGSPVSGEFCSSGEGISGPQLINSTLSRFYEIYPAAFRTSSIRAGAISNKSPTIP